MDYVTKFPSSYSYFWMGANITFQDVTGDAPQQNLSPNLNARHFHVVREIFYRRLFAASGQKWSL